MKKLKSIVLIVLACAMCAGIIGGLSGCKKSFDPWEVKEEDQGFYYYVHSENDEEVATILGLVNSSIERDELVIPEKLGGYRVVQIGYVLDNTGLSWYYKSYVHYGIDTSNIKKIVINHDLFFSYGGSEHQLQSFLYFKWVVVVVVNCEIKGLERTVPIYVEFDFVGGVGETFAMVTWINNKIFEPKMPTKNDYTFVGWYKDDKYETIWNFDEDILENTTTLYAKWVVNKNTKTNNKENK